jgi:hypothetical protein
MDRATRNIILGLTVAVVVLLGLLTASVLGLITTRQRLAALESNRHAATLGRISRVSGAFQTWTASQPVAADSVEGQLRSHGKRWVRSNEPITIGSYVEDILDPRLNQPTGRGAVGKVLAISPPNGGPVAADVDFGRGYVTGIDVRELAAVTVLPATR